MRHCKNRNFRELTLERQAFEATMRINNSLDSFELSNIGVDLVFREEDEKPVIVSSDASASTADFYVRLDDTTGINGLSDLGRGRINNGSIAAGTQVLTQDPDGEKSSKAIETLEVGDQVLAKNVATGEQGYKPVEQLFIIQEQPLYELVLEDSESGERESIEVTDDHPIWVKDFGWLNSIHLVLGLEDERRDGKTLTVVDFKCLNKVETTYNLEVSVWHTYYAGDAGLLVYNCDEKITSTAKNTSKSLEKNNQKNIVTNEATDSFSDRLLERDLKQGTDARGNANYTKAV